MSLVGTRPPTLDEWEKYEPHHRARMSFRPGLTGLWQVSGRSNITDFAKHFYKEIHKLGGKVYLNPDGHEWMRAKWSKHIRKYCGINHSRISIMISNPITRILISFVIHSYMLQILFVSYLILGGVFRFLLIFLLIL